MNDFGRVLKLATRKRLALFGILGEEGALGTIEPGKQLVRAPRGARRQDRNT